MAQLERFETISFQQTSVGFIEKNTHIKAISTSTKGTNITSSMFFCRPSQCVSQNLDRKNSMSSGPPSRWPARMEREHLDESIGSEGLDGRMGVKSLDPSWPSWTTWKRHNTMALYVLLDIELSPRVMKTHPSIHPSIYLSIYLSIYILYSIFYILYSIFYILYSIFYILNSKFYILYSIFYILYSIFYILYIIYSYTCK